MRIAGKVQESELPAISVVVLDELFGLFAVSGAQMLGVPFDLALATMGYVAQQH